MKKKVIFLSLSFIFYSCATVPNYYSFDDALEIGIEKIVNDLPDMAQIAILDFKSNNENMSSYIIGEMYDKLINSESLVIMERSRTETIAMEVGYQLSGEVDDNQIISIGHQLGANYVVTGEIIFTGEVYRLRIFAIAIESGRRIASSSLNINPNDRQINYLATSNITRNAGSNDEVTLNDVLKIRQNNVFLDRQGGHNVFLLKKRPFEILVPYGNQVIYIRPFVSYRSYALPIDLQEIFYPGMGMAESYNQEERDLYVNSNVYVINNIDTIGFHYITPDRMSLDIATGMARIHYRNVMFSDNRSRNRVFLIVFIDYNSNKIVEENEIMYLTLQFT